MPQPKIATPSLSLADETLLAAMYAKVFNSFNNPKSNIVLHHTSDGAVKSSNFMVGAHAAESDGPFLKVITLRPQSKQPKLRYYSYHRASNLLSVSGQGLVP
jgi:hypothetical protein